jgi:PAS domain-containing protein
MSRRRVLRLFQGLIKPSADTVAFSARLLLTANFVLLVMAGFAPGALAAEGAAGPSIFWPALGAGMVLGGGLAWAYFYARRSRGHGELLENIDDGDFHQIADLAGDWVWEMDKDLRFSYLSDRFSKYFPLSRTVF